MGRIDQFIGAGKWSQAEVSYGCQSRLDSGTPTPLACGQSERNSLAMSQPMANGRKARPRPRRNPYGELIHRLNQRYHAEWERAEALQRKLTRLQRWGILPVVEWLGRQARRLRGLFTRSRPLELLQECFPYVPGRFASVPAGLVSIIIPFRDRPELLKNCLRSLNAGTYRHFELVLVDNGSTELRMQRLLDRYGARPGVQVVNAPGEFNFARLCNLGASRASGEFLLFLNNDTEVLDRDWLEQLLLIAGDSRVGAAGATLLYPDRTIQHSGLFPHSDGVWVHPFRGQPENSAERLRSPRCVPAVTAACMMVRRELFDAVDGFDERFAVMHNDVDLCARLRQRGLLVVVTPHARLFHYESLSRGYALDDPLPTSS
jgi:GT2 family glycosyltransferase